jgi:hypothetical protein
MSSQIRMQADDFFNAYLVLKANYDTASLTIMVPSIVNLAFSVELYIKDLHFRLRGRVPRGHNILRLFEQLPLHIKKEVFEHNSISGNPFAIRGDLFSPGIFSPAYSPYNRFIDQINAMSDGFEKWRYSYESVSLKYDSSFVLALIEAVKSISDGVTREQ